MCGCLREGERDEYGVVGGLRKQRRGEVAVSSDGARKKMVRREANHSGRLSRRTNVVMSVRMRLDISGGSLVTKKGMCQHMPTEIRYSEGVGRLLTQSARLVTNLETHPDSVTSDHP